MIKSSPRSRNLATNSLFGAFFLTLFGWGLLHAWGVHIHARVLTHILLAIPGLALAGVTLYRYRRHWPIDHGSRFHLDFRAISCCLLLAAAGLGLALFVIDGSIFLLALGALGMVLVPWTRISVCRTHFFISSAMMTAGAVSGLVLLSGSVHPLYYPLAAWVLLVIACTAVFSAVLTHGGRLDRMPMSGYSAMTSVSRLE